MVRKSLRLEASNGKEVKKLVVNKCSTTTTTINRCANVSLEEGESLSKDTTYTLLLPANSNYHPLSNPTKNDITQKSA